MYDGEVKIFNPEHRTLHGNEGSFEPVEIRSSDDLLLAHQVTLEALFRREGLLGRGNNAFVFDAVRTQAPDVPKATCIKAVWSRVYANIKEGGELPAFLKPLRMIQYYFEQIKEKRRLFEARGFEFLPQADIESEARYTNRAHLFLKDAGVEVAVPWVSEIITIDRDGDGEDGDGHPYMWKEKVKLLVMDKIEGVTIEELILGHGQHEDIRPCIDFESFAEKLRKAIDVLHAHGLYHNDLSTRNIMITSDGKPVLIDFGAGHHYPDGQPNDEAYQKNRDDLEKTLKWLSRYLNNPSEVSAELQRKLDK